LLDAHMCFDSGFLVERHVGSSGSLARGCELGSCGTSDGTVHFLR
jgi:hypothetical protein